MALTDIKLKSLKPRDRIYKVSDGEGLFIQVSPKGTKSWRIAYRFDGKQKTMSLGTYPETTLREAREIVGKTKDLLEQNMDPIAVRNTGASATSYLLTFSDIGDKWFNLNLGRWVPNYTSRLRSRLVDDVYSQIGDTPINMITPPDVLKVIRRIEARGAIETGRRIQQMISAIFQFAVGEGVADRDPAADIVKSLAPLKPTKRRAALPGDQMPSFMKQLDDYVGDVVTIKAMRIIAHTFVRTNELRMAEWTEFTDLDGREPNWRIPAEKMKMRREHQVPLSKQATRTLMEMREISGDQKWVFPSPVFGKEGPISTGTLIYAMYRLGYRSRATVHGFRSTASTVLNENEFNRDWIEIQLAHADQSVRGIYNSALYLRQRREMMQWWSDFIEPPQCMFEDILG